MTLAARRGSLPERVKRLNTEATNLKTAQYTGWDSIRCYLTETTRTWDLSMNLDSGAFNADLTTLVKFTADHQNAPFAKMIMEIQVDNTNTYRVGTTTTSGTYDYSVATNGTVPDVFGNYSPVKTPNGMNEVGWYDYIQVTGAHNIKIKVRVYSTDTGKITASYELDALNTVRFI